jgi:hypothetical protein
MLRRVVSVGYGTIFLASTLFAQQAAYTLEPTPKTVMAPKVRMLTPAPQAQDEKQRIIYVKHLVPPHGYPPLARQTRLRGTILIKLTIAADGTVLNRESTPGDKDTTGFQLLRDDAEKLVKKWTFGCVGCPPNAPFEHTIKFNYRLDNEDVLPDNWITMDLPDEVTIYTSPVMIDHGGPPPKKSKKGSN